MKYLSRFAWPLVAAGLVLGSLATPASAVTVSETSYAGGDFSNSLKTPTAIASRIGNIKGTLRKGDRDVLKFTGMQTGAQTVTLNLAATGIGPLWQGNVRYGTTPLANSASGILAGNIAMSNLSPTLSVMSQTITFNLAATFSGTLYLSLYLQRGTGATYSLRIPGNVPAAVPLPASALLLGGAVAALGARRRKGAAA